jgi:hypothetical protein
MEIQATEVEGILFQGFTDLVYGRSVRFHGWGNVRSQGYYLHEITHNKQARTMISTQGGIETHERCVSAT